MQPADFNAFLDKHSLTHQAAAAVLGRSKRQIEYYLRGEQIPRVLVLACIGYAARCAQCGSKASTTTDLPGAVVWPAGSFVTFNNLPAYGEIRQNATFGTLKEQHHINLPGGAHLIFLNAQHETAAVANTGRDEPTYIFRQERRYG